MSVFISGTPVKYWNQNLTPYPIRAKIVDLTISGQYELRLEEDGIMTDPQTGETRPKKAGDTMYAFRRQLELI